MDITCPYCGQCNLSAIKPICIECNKYWFISDIYSYKMHEDEKYRLLYIQSLSSDKFFLKKDGIYKNVIKMFNIIKIEYQKLKNFIRLLLTNIYIRGIRVIPDNISDIEHYKNKIINLSNEILKFKNIINLSPNHLTPKILVPKLDESNLSKIYDCKALIESKRCNIPPTFKNNRILVQLLRYISKNNFYNLERSLVDYGALVTVITHESFYLYLEYILENFSEIGSKDFDDKCIEIFNKDKYRYIMCYFSIYEMLDIIK